MTTRPLSEQQIDIIVDLYVQGGLSFNFLAIQMKSTPQKVRAALVARNVHIRTRSEARNLAHSRQADDVPLCSPSGGGRKHKLYREGRKGKAE